MGCVCVKKLENSKDVAIEDLQKFGTNSKARFSTLNDTVITIDLKSIRRKDILMEKDKLTKKQQNLNLDEIVKKLYIVYNNLRADPTSFIPKIEEYIKQVKNCKSNENKEMSYMETASGYKIMFEENGVCLLNEAIIFLRKQKRLLNLETDELLMVSAKKGLENIVDIDKEKRIENLKLVLEKFTYGEKNYVNRIIGYGDYDPFTIILLQLIDQSDNYNSRVAIFSEKLRNIGIYAKFHKKLKIIVLTDFSC
jgi:hypothetical protein